jgi:hypothetical protein
MTGYLFVITVMLTIVAGSSLSMARTMKRWSYVVREQGEHLKALNNVNAIHQEHLRVLHERVEDREP